MLNGRKRRFLQEVNFKVFKNHLKRYIKTYK